MTLIQQTGVQQIGVRQIGVEDENQWRTLWAKYLTFYHQPFDESLTAHLFATLLSEAGHFGFVAEKDGEIIGFAHGLTHASTWSMNDYCYLEDLFVDAGARGAGAGRKLIEAIYQRADDLSCSRVYWHTDQGNDKARALYDSLASLSDFVQYRRS